MQSLPRSHSIHLINIYVLSVEELVVIVGLVVLMLDVSVLLLAFVVGRVGDDPEVSRRYSRAAVGISFLGASPASSTPPTPGGETLLDLLLVVMAENVATNRGRSHPRVVP